MFKMLTKWTRDNRPAEVLSAKDAPIDWFASISMKGSTAPYENLPPVIDYCDDDHWVEFDSVEMKHDLRTYAANDPYPIPATSDREGYHGTRHYDYWLSGLSDYLHITRALERQDIHLEDSSKVLDFGCASGRVLRHLLCHEKNLDLWGTDINGRHVEWIRRFLPPSVEVFQNSVLPYLPLEDNSFSLVYAFSVFTHIDRFELAWLAELRRILRIGGFAYLTFHSDHTWQTMSPKRQLYHDLLAMKDYIPDYEVTPELFNRPMPSERTVLTWHLPNATDCSIFHSTDYIENSWGRFFEIVDIVREGHDYQDVVLLRKRR